MKSITKIIAALGLVFIFTLCKKGEDDPALSLRSRKARVVGDWALSSGTLSTVSRYGSAVYSSNQVFTGNAFSQTSSYTNGGTSNVTTSTGVYSYKIKFEKNGTFSLTEILENSVNIQSGTWNFTGKVGDYKNKEKIVLYRESGTGLSGSSTISYSGDQVFKTFSIKELRNKKMVLVTESMEVGGSESVETHSEIILEQ
jgi:hypothetical protein